MCVKKPALALLNTVVHDVGMPIQVLVTLILIFAPYYAPRPIPCPVLCMIRERHVILKEAFHSRLAV